MMGWLLPLIVLAGVAAMPFLAEGRRQSAETFRDRAPGRFAKLSAGVTHYRWLGAARGPVVVCVHGLSTPSPVWYALAQHLGQLGFRVLVYDLYGRGFSDAPKDAQTSEFFARQLDDLLVHQQINDDVTVIGFSMGGTIAAGFTAQHPDRVRRLILVASAGVWMRPDPWVEAACALPVVGAWIHHIIVARRERRALQAHLGQPFDIPGIIEAQLAEYNSKGFLPSLLSSRRNVLSETQEEAQRNIGRAGVPVVGIWAERDTVIPLKSLGTLTQWNRSVRQEVISDADHRVLYTHSAEVANLLTQILREDVSH
ncbi:alpha/beta fold hydrolase [Pseudooctadecabacter jejudonensis]|uniref:Arylesterase n=1 Tax=Pseudooctadecabacter jejudonensis TaxID=1391910 RepID=A0A1Y5S125_9RHOB|nr:alpha/beta hydrolase [Pseudooctadecabacter jejudonensis]SLN30224.1 Arylesterase [Pseudooctadecabacter jejudonensis]